ncbi:DNA primase small subunit [Babesia caballi]|uniref:DNA primase small subunit n=1 Tax=Babesia caballi TaxID=5871 RepID=A0AAV4LSF0_BABCB|nr:DNA primase small subunit [Babesia caballi]
MPCAEGMCSSPTVRSSLEDPALRNGMSIYLFRECQTEIRDAASELGSLQCILNYKVLCGADAVEVEITSESDLFFNYIHRVTKDDYRGISERQRLTASFELYHVTISKMIVSCIESQTFQALLFLKGTEGTLQFVQVICSTCKHKAAQNAEYKFIELLECSLQRANEFRVVDNITYRYNFLKDRLNHFGKHLEVRPSTRQPNVCRKSTPF